MSFFGLNTHELNRLRQTAVGFILKRHWIATEILPYVLRYLKIAPMLDFSFLVPGVREGPPNFRGNFLTPSSATGKYPNGRLLLILLVFPSDSGLDKSHFMLPLRLSSGSFWLSVMSRNFATAIVLLILQSLDAVVLNSVDQSPLDS